MNEVRVQLMAKGVRGLVTLRRALRSSDLSGSGRLSTEEFHRALSVCQIALTDRVSAKSCFLLFNELILIRFL